MNPMQIMAMLQNSGNPMMMLTQLAQHPLGNFMFSCSFLFQLLHFMHILGIT